MEAVKQEKNKINDFAFYLLMSILGSSVLVVIGFLVYEIIFG